MEILQYSVPTYFLNKIDIIYKYKNNKYHSLKLSGKKGQQLPKNVLRLIL